MNNHRPFRPGLTRTGSAALVLMFGMLAMATSDGPAGRLIGRWDGGGLVITFNADGTGLFGTRACFWSVQGDTLQLKDRQNPAHATRYAIRWEGEALLLQHADGSRYELRRATAPAPAPAEPAAPGGSAAVSKIALAQPGGYFPSADGACRLPVPPGGQVRSRTIKGGPFYDALKNMVIQRPDRTIQEVMVGATAIGTLVSFQGGFYPVGGNGAQDAFTRAVGNFMKQVITEDGRYRPVGQPQQSTWNGIPKTSLVLESDSGLRRTVFYFLEQLREEGAPALSMSLRLDEAGYADFHGLKARLCGDIVVVARACISLEVAESGKYVDTAIGIVAGLQVRPLGPNPALSQAVLGAWSGISQAGASTFTGADYNFLADGRFTRRVTVSSDIVAGHGGLETGTYQVRGNCIHFRFADGQEETYPLRVEGRVLQIGGASYTR